MSKIAPDQPIYSIGIVSDLLQVPAETIRIWEKAGVIPPSQRRGGKRFYSQKELKRLRFAHGLSKEGLSVRAILYYLQLYPCWKTGNCPGCQNQSSENNTSKPCWQVEGAYCQVANIDDPCSSGQAGDEKKQPEIKVIEQQTEKNRVR